MSDVAQLMRAANPVPDAAVAITDSEFDALLLLTQSRSGKVEVQEVTKPVEPEKKQRRGWLVAAAAFAAVIVVIGAVMLLGNNAEELPPATTPPTTQAVAPTTVPVVEEEALPPTTQASATATTVPTALSAAEEQFVADFVAAFNGGTYDTWPGDFDEYLGLFAANAAITTPWLVDATNLETYENELAFRGAWNTQLTSNGCRHEFNLIRCDMEFSSDGVESFVGPVPIMISLTVEDNEITSMNWSRSLAPAAAPIDLRATQFLLWLEEGYGPGISRTMFIDNGSLANPVLNEESLALWLELLPQYEATLEE